MSGGRNHAPTEDDMTILSTMFGSDSAAAIGVGSIVFLLIYFGGFILFQTSSRIRARTPVFDRHLIPGLGAALAASWVGFWLHAANVATASAEGQGPTSISPQELHRAIRMESLPVQTFEDQTMVFPHRE